MLRLNPSPFVYPLPCKNFCVSLKLQELEYSILGSYSNISIMAASTIRHNKSERRIEKNTIRVRISQFAGSMREQAALDIRKRGQSS
jgi:hypothetical protein